MHNGAFSGPGGGAPTDPTDATWTFADSTAAPVWVAYQEGDGPWTRIAPTTAGDTVRYAFTARGRGGLAVVTRGLGADAGYDLAVYYGTAAELVGFGRGQTAALPPVAPAGTKRLTGAVAGGGMFSQTFVTLGSAAGSVTPGQSTFSLRNVAAGPQDLFAALSTFDISGPTPSIVLSKLIIRRGLDLADGSAIPTLDFDAAEAFAPATPKLEVTGASGARIATMVSYRTAGGASGMLSTGVGGDHYYGVPQDRQVAGDMHVLTVMAIAGGDDDDPFGLGSGAAAGTGDARAVMTSFVEARDRTVALGPELEKASIVAVDSGKYARWRATLPRQAEYGAGLIATFGQDEARRHVTVMMTEGYVGDAKSWELTVPDLAAADGFDATWGPRPGAAPSWTLSAYGGDFAAAFAVATARGAAPEDGVAFRYATHTGKGATPPAVAARARRR